MAKPIHFPVVNYMIIDVTTVEHTRLLKVATLRESALWGQLYIQQGHKVIAPPVEGRGFSKLDKLQLQYFYWNVCKETPPEDYQELVRKCLAVINALPVADTSIQDLEREIELYKPDVTNQTSVAKAPKDPNAPAPRPGKTSTTGIVWIIADEQFVKAGNVMPERKAVIDACVAEEINPATASTQYSKWAKAKRIQLGIDL